MSEFISWADISGVTHTQNVQQDAINWAHIHNFQVLAHCGASQVEATAEMTAEKRTRSKNPVFDITDDQIFDIKYFK